jgi:hypothetical protein
VKRKRRLVRALTYTVAVLAFGELIARHYISGPLDFLRASPDPLLLFEIQPGHYVSDGYLMRVPETEYVVDERGCRVVERRTPPAGPPILFVGSSIAFGIGVDAVDSLPEATRDAVRAHRSDLDFIPENCGTPGHVLLQMLHFAELELQRSPGRPIVMIVSPTHARIVHDWRALTPSSPLLHWLTSHSRLVRLVYLYPVVRDAQRMDVPVPAEQLAAALDHFSTQVHASGGRVLFFVLGTFKHPSFDLPAELARRGLSAQSIAEPAGAYRLSDGDHWGTDGLRAIADEMVPGVVALLDDRTVGGAQKSE